MAKKITVKGELVLDPMDIQNAHVIADAANVVSLALAAHNLGPATWNLRDERIRIENGKLVEQEDISYHGSPCWQTKRIISEDAAYIKAYKLARAFNDKARRAARTEIEFRGELHVPTAGKDPYAVADARKALVSAAAALDIPCTEAFLDAIEPFACK